MKFLVIHTDDLCSGNAIDLYSGHT